MLCFHFLNVNNGDCIIVEYRTGCEVQFGLVDCNRPADRKTSPALSKLQSLGAERLSFVCLTHPDKDHYSGIYDVLNHYAGKIDTFYICPIGELAINKGRLKILAKQYRDIIEKQDNKEITAKSLEFIQILMHCEEYFLPDRFEELSGEFNQLAPVGFAGVNINSILPPKKIKGTFYTQLSTGEASVGGEVQNNQLSIALYFSYKGKSIILGGDGTRENWSNHRRWQARGGTNISSQAVKLPHHGSKRDCEPVVLDYLFANGTERIGVVSAAGKAHPDDSVIDWMLDNGVRPVCTNLCKRWKRNEVRNLIPLTGLDPTLCRWLNEVGDVDLTHSTPCKGDIAICIEDDGEISLQTEFDPGCFCDPTFASLTMAVT